MLDKIKKLIDSIPGAIWDEEPEPSRSLTAADLMISSASGICTDFAAIYGKPVIALEMKEMDVSSYEFDILPKEIRDLALSWKSYIPVSVSEMGNIKDIVKAALEGGKGADFAELVRANIANLGTAGEHIADYLIEKSKVLPTHGD